MVHPRELLVRRAMSFQQSIVFSASLRPGNIGKTLLEMIALLPIGSTLPSTSSYFQSRKSLGTATAMRCSCVAFRNPMGRDPKAQPSSIRSISGPVTLSSVLWSSFDSDLITSAQAVTQHMGMTKIAKTMRECIRNETSACATKCSNVSPATTFKLGMTLAVRPLHAEPLGVNPALQS